MGTKYSEALGATYLDENGESHPIVMGSYGIGVGRLMGSIIEHHHDENGIQWPITVAPYQVALISLATVKAPEVSLAADELYSQLMAAGVEVLAASSLHETPALMPEGAPADWDLPFLNQVHGLDPKAAAATTSILLVAWALGVRFLWLVIPLQRKMRSSVLNKVT